MRVSTANDAGLPFVALEVGRCTLRTVPVTYVLYVAPRKRAVSGVRLVGIRPLWWVRLVGIRPLWWVRLVGIRPLWWVRLVGIRPLWWVRLVGIRPL